MFNAVKIMILFAHVHIKDNIMFTQQRLQSHPLTAKQGSYTVYTMLRE